MSEAKRPRRDRLTEVQSLIDEMNSEPDIPEGCFSSLGMLVTDASLAADEPSLRAAHDGLRGLYGSHVRDGDAGVRAEQRGRLLGLIDVTYWSLRRLPSGLQLTLDPTGHAAQFLTRIAQEPGLNNEQLALRLGVDITEVSRIGRKMVASGVAWKSRQWRFNSWGLTPRGAQYLEQSGLLAVEEILAGPPAAREVEPEGPDHFVGVKVRPTLLTGVVTDAAGQTLARHVREHKPVRSEDEATEALAGFVRELLARAPAAAERAKAGMTGLGVEVGGHVSSEPGEIVHAPNYAPDMDWTGLSLAKPLQAATGLPTVLENDANALALLEWTLGDAGSSRNLATVILDTGVGAGLLVDGAILHGATGAAGELGHVLIESQGGRTCRCGNEGCLESVVGAEALIRRIGARTGERVPDLDTAVGLLGHAECGGFVEETLEEAGRALGCGLADLLNMTNPDRLVLYGPPALVSEREFPSSAKIFMNAVRATAERHAFSTVWGDVTLMAKPYRDDLGARAAAAVAQHRLSRK